MITAVNESLCRTLDADLQQNLPLPFGQNRQSWHFLLLCSRHSTHHEALVNAQYEKVEVYPPNGYQQPPLQCLVISVVVEVNHQYLHSLLVPPIQYHNARQKKSKAKPRTFTRVERVERKRKYLHKMAFEDND